MALFEIDYYDWFIDQSRVVLLEIDPFVVGVPIADELDLYKAAIEEAYANKGEYDEVRSVSFMGRR